MLISLRHQCIDTHYMMSTNLLNVTLIDNLTMTSPFGRYIKKTEHFNNIADLPDSDILKPPV